MEIFFLAKADTDRWKYILRPILVCLLHFHYVTPSSQGNKDLDTFGKRKTSFLKCSQPINGPIFSIFSCFLQNWAQLTKRLEQLQCYPPCHGSSNTNLGGERNRNFSVLPVHLLFPESKTILQGSVNSHKGVSWVTCQVHAVIFVTAVDISQLYSVSGKAKCQAQVVHKAQNSGLVLTETSTPRTARGAVTEHSFPSALQLGRDYFLLLIWPPFNFLFIAAYNDI